MWISSKSCHECTHSNMRVRRLSKSMKWKQPIQQKLILWFPIQIGIANLSLNLISTWIKPWWNFWIDHNSHTVAANGRLLQLQLAASKPRKFSHQVSQRSNVQIDKIWHIYHGVTIGQALDSWHHFRINEQWQNAKKMRESAGKL